MKDKRTLEDYLILTGVEEAVLRLASGEERAGEDLRKLVELARKVRNLLNGLHSRYNRQVVEQAAILVSSVPIFSAIQEGQGRRAYIAKRLNALSKKPSAAGKANSAKMPALLSPVRCVA